MNEYLHVQIVYAHNHSTGLDKYLHVLIVYAYVDFPSALQYNHIRHMDRLKDRTKGKIHKCQFTFKYPLPQHNLRLEENPLLQNQV